MYRLSKKRATYHLILSLLVAGVLAGCSAFTSFLYRADIKQGSASITYNRLNGAREEKLTLPDDALYALVEASTQGGSLVVILKYPDGSPVAGFVVNAKESTKVEQLGPFPRGTYLIELRGNSSSGGAVKITFTS